MDDFFSILKLYRSKNVGPIGYNFLLKNYKTAENVLEDQKFLEENTKIVFAKNEDIEREISWTHKLEGSFITNIPLFLKKIYDAPPILIAKGNLDLLKEKTISIVGTRNPTKEGLAFCAKFCQNLDFTTVSGLAIGIDTCVHENSKKTIAILPCGIDKVYPICNDSLIQVKNGLLLTENPVGFHLSANAFPIRNRIIAGFSSSLI